MCRHPTDAPAGRASNFASLQACMSFTFLSGLQKCSISAMVNSRRRSRPWRGEISLRKPWPICAAAKGSLPPL